MGIFAVLVAASPLIFSFTDHANRMTGYLIGLSVVVGLDVGVTAVILTWRSVIRSRLGEWQFTVDSYQSSMLRSLLLGSGMHLLALFSLWLPLLATGEGKQSSAPFAVCLTLASFAALTSLPWLVQFALNVKGHDLEVHQEGLLMGGFFPCRWQQIVAYQIWEDECALVSIEIRGRGPCEVFMSQIDRKMLVEVLQEHVGPPSSLGRSEDLPDNRHKGPPTGLTIFR
ncbi:hypothetical protein C5Y93_11130 [Blastopirellula marina]|uniref:Uncharacterized protein n=1 Tax=Blastopirellula marina TaxID=124 RepID=A0A2S8GNW8_9BACT|nr:hypothetical protein C5Y93_11130 [Blastopirellula marina]